ncbi:M6 family metalloprotease domain-containing protein, partial [bacterium]
MYTITKILIKTIIILSIFVNSAFAIAPPKPDVYDVRNGNIKLKSRNQKKLLTPPKFSKSMPYTAPYTNPEIYPLIIMIEFQDVKADVSHNIAYFQKLVFSKTSTDRSMYNYYLENSGSKLKIEDKGQPSAWLVSAYNMSAYGMPTVGSVDNGPEYLALEAIQLLNGSSFDFSKFDANGDGNIDCLIIVHSGNAEEQSANTNDIWSHRYTVPRVGSDYYTTHDGYKAVDYLMVSEQTPLGIFCHEFGHILGLPDLYSTYTGQSVCGTWAVMDLGSWLDSGNTPCHMCAPMKAYMGWGNYQIISTETKGPQIYPTSRIEDSADTTEFYKLPILGSSDEYFMVEYRHKESYDSMLPGSGVLIWHVDNLIINNNLATNTINVDPDHLGIELEEADGTDCTLAPNYSEIGDMYRTGAVFSSPQNMSYQGISSNIIISDFSGAGTGIMSFDVYTYGISPVQNVLDFFNYPNPIYSG